MKKIFWLAGEHSGDLHASYVIRNIGNEGYEHFGIGGKQMEIAGLRTILSFQRFNVMGFWEVIKHLHFFIKVEKLIINTIKMEKPDLVILVDYPGLNMRIAKKAKLFGFKILYYISPQFWAWKKKRLRKLKRFTDHICYILPFEGKYFREINTPSTFVGHPIKEEIHIKRTKKNFVEMNILKRERKIIGFFPGSRKIEIERLLPIFIDTAMILDQNGNYEFLISRADGVQNELFNYPQFKQSNFHVIDGSNYEIMKYSDFLIVKSGTSTLEAAFIGTPFIIVYKTSRISYEIGKRIIKIKQIGLPNLVFEQDIVPEFVQNRVNPQNLAYQVEMFLCNDEKYGKMKTELKKLDELLGKKKASLETAKIIRQMLNE